MKAAKTIMVVTGEVSSDQHAAAVVRALKRISPEYSVLAMGGSHLAAAGAEIIVDINTHGSVMGLTEVLGSLGKIVKAFRTLLRTARQRRPALVMLVDYPDFNLRLAKKLHREGIPVLYFISPQLWAWRQGRAKLIKRCVRKVATIFPFEETFYQGLGIDAEFVGHPFLDREPLHVDREKMCRDLNLDPDQPVVALLPGSRKREVETLFAPLVETVLALRSDIPNLQAIIPLAPTVKKSWYAHYGALPAGVATISGQAVEVLQLAQAGIIASGTAAMEAVLAELPMMVVYKLNGLSYWLAKRLIRGVRNFAMPNIIAGKEIISEYLQEQVTPAVLAPELKKLLVDGPYRAQMKEQLRGVRAKLKHREQGSASAGERVAKIIIDLVDSNGK